MRARAAKPKTAVADNSAGTMPLLSRHRGAGAPLQIQRKLSIGAVNDPLEHEADRVADQVMRMPEAPSGSRAVISTASAPAALAKSASSGGGIAAPPIVHEVLNSPGQPLDAATRAFMEPRFGRDFSQVRVHAGGSAAEAAAAINARAFALDRNIVFGAGEYAPRTESGRRLLGHELAHVVQQRPVLQMQSHAAKSGEGNKKGADAKAAASSDELTDKQIEAAKDLAKAAGLGKEAILSLQKELGVSSKPPGEYDGATAAAVYKQQLEWRGKSKESVKHPGFAAADEFRRLGLIPTKSYVAGSASGNLLDELGSEAPNGVTAAVYANYKYPTSGTEKKRKATAANNAEFQRAASQFASDKNNMVVGLKNGAVTPRTAMPATSPAEAIELVQGTHLGLLQAYQKQHPGEKNEPEFTKFRNLALFAHGYGAGIALSDSDHNYALGLHSDDRDNDDSKANVGAFVAGLSGAITSDVRVELFACNVARSPTLESDKGGPLEGAKKGTVPSDLQVQGAKGGADSLPATIATAIGPNASVYAHLTAAHTTENFAARAFGKDAGSAAPSGVHTFDLMYDETFIQTQLKSLIPDAEDSDVAANISERTRLHDPLREVMWKRYVDLIQGEQVRRNKIYDAAVKENAAKRKLKNATEAETAANKKAAKDKKAISVEDAKKMADAVKTAETELETAVTERKNLKPLLYPLDHMGQIMFADRNAKTKFQDDWNGYWTEVRRSAFLKANKKPTKK